MQLKKKSTTKKYNIMDISEIKFSISKNKNITYWAKVNYDWKRVSSCFYKKLLDLGIKTISNLNTENKTVQIVHKSDIIKTNLGQFYTKNCNYILKGMFILPGVRSIIEPFAGAGDLMKWARAQSNKAMIIEGYDIEPKSKNIKKRDTFKSILDYNSKFVITNPPFLSKNKAQDKAVFNLYGADDLYKCFILQLIEPKNICFGGILILPLNFFCSFRKQDLNLRKRFLTFYTISLINIFELPTFQDTNYTVCSFMFSRKSLALDAKTKVCLYPSKQIFFVQFGSKNLYSFSDSVFDLLKAKLFSIERVTKFNELSPYVTNILVQCIDNNKKQINAQIVATNNIFCDRTKNNSARSFLSLSIKPKIPLNLQRNLVVLFNDFLNKKRTEFFSLFLSQFRELDRKRISFQLIYKIFGHLLKIYVENDIKIIDINNLRKKHQNQSEAVIRSLLLKPGLRLEELKPYINNSTLNQVLKGVSSELGSNFCFEDLCNKCLSDPIFRVSISKNIVILPSRQGITDELHILNEINSFTCKVGVFVNKPKPRVLVYRNTIGPKRNEKSKFRSLDGVVTGKLSGYLFCKVILGQGPTQSNSWNEAELLLQWAIKNKYKNNLIFLIDTDMFSKFEEFKLAAEGFSNLLVFNHIEFQLWVKASQG